MRIASLLSAATEILYALDLGDQVVAVSHECDYPADVAKKPRITFSRVDAAAASGDIDRQVRAACERGESLYGIDEDLLARLAPDLIVTQAQCDVCAVNYDEVVAAVQRLDSDTHTNIVALNPASLQEIFEDIHRVADAADCPSSADSLLARLRARVDAVREATTELSADQRPRVAVIEWIEPVMLAANWVPELLELAGGQCQLTAAGQHSDYVDWKEILQYDPEVIIVVPCGFDLARTVQEAATLKQSADWHCIRAVRDGRVWAIDGNAYFNRSGPRIVDSLEILAYLLHPHLFQPPVESDHTTWCELR